MGSLIKVPSRLQRTLITINLSKNSFRYFSTCGAIISDNIEDKINSTAIKQNGQFFDEDYYIEYLDFYQEQITKYHRRFFSDGNESTTHQTSKLTINIVENSFEQFNYLKNERSFNPQTYQQSYIGRVHHRQLRNIGLILDINNNAQQLKIKVSDNSFFKIRNHITNQVNEKTARCDFAQGEYKMQQQNQLNQKDLAFLQFQHLFSLRNISEAFVVIAENQFKSLSLTGPLIYFEEMNDKNASFLVLFKNNFNNVHSYLGPAILDVRRNYTIIEVRTFDGFFSDQYVLAGVTIEILSQFSTFGGRILVKDNTLQNVIACPQADASAFVLQVSYDRDLPDAYGQMKNLPSLKPIYQPNSNTNGVYVNDVLETSRINLKDNWKTVLYKNESFILNDQVSRFISNSYEEVAMGVTIEHENNWHRGSQIKLNNVFAFEFIDETFKNVGAFTQEKLCEILMNIYEDSSCTLLAKQNLDLTYWNKFLNGNMINHDFFNKALSAGLIFSNMGASIKFLGKNVFHNVWLIDRKNALLLNQDEGNTKYGLIIYCSQFKGQVTIGGVSSHSKYNSEDQITSFTNLTGFLTEYTMEKYPLWSPSTWANAQASDAHEILEHGLGSILFNLQDENNYLVKVTLQNANFRYIFSRPSGTNIDTKQPSILSTTINSKIYVYNKAINVKDVFISDVSYEKGASFFELSADTMNIDNLHQLTLATLTT